MMTVLATCAAIVAMAALLDQLTKLERKLDNMREALIALHEGRGEFIDIGGGRFTVRWRTR